MNENQKKNQNKTYNSRDEFLNDDGLTDEEKTEICENLIESMEK